MLKLGIFAMKCNCLTPDQPNVTYDVLDKPCPFLARKRCKTCYLTRPFVASHHKVWIFGIPKAIENVHTMVKRIRRWPVGFVLLIILSLDEGERLLCSDKTLISFQVNYTIIGRNNQRFPISWSYLIHSRYSGSKYTVYGLISISSPLTKLWLLHIPRALLSVHHNKTCCLFSGLGRFAPDNLITDVHEPQSILGDVYQRNKFVTDVWIATFQFFSFQFSFDD